MINLNKSLLVFLFIMESEVIDNNSSFINQSLECSICNKKFKTQKTYMRRVLKQLCCPNHLRTYCLICEIDLETRENYKKHLCTLSHIQKVDDIQVADYTLEEEENKKNKLSAAFQADPYLNKTEKEEFTPSISQLNNSSSNSNSESESESNHSQTEQSQSETQPDPPSYEDSSNLEKSIPIASEKQSKILTLLSKIYNEDDAEPKFLKLLNSLKLPDYRNLSILIINYQGIPILQKQKFMNVIEKYKSLLIKKNQQGIEEFNGKCIKDIINLL